VLETQRPSWKRRKQKQEKEHAARVLVAKQANSKLRRVLDDISDNNAEPLKELVADVSKAETHLLGYERRARVMLEYTTLLLENGGHAAVDGCVREGALGANGGVRGAQM
jgi:hypothetical protein